MNGLRFVIQYLYHKLLRVEQSQKAKFSWVQAQILGYCKPNLPGFAPVVLYERKSSLFLTILLEQIRNLCQWRPGWGARGPPEGRAPPADFFEGAPKFKKGAKNLMKLHGLITFISVGGNKI